MDGTRGTTVGRRGLLYSLTAGVAVVASVAASYQPAAAAETSGASDRGKRQSRYQPNSAEVNTYYRVNSYPTR
jgi:hypothetical protein